MLHAKLKAEDALENLIQLSAEGARSLWAESLRQKDRADTHGCLRMFSPELLIFSSFLYFRREKSC